MTETGEPGITETAGVRRHEVPERCRPRELLVWSGAGRGYLRRAFGGVRLLEGGAEAEIRESVCTRECGHERPPPETATVGLLPAD